MFRVIAIHDPPRPRQSHIYRNRERFEHSGDSKHEYPGFPNLPQISQRCTLHFPTNFLLLLPPIYKTVNHPSNNLITKKKTSFRRNLFETFGRRKNKKVWKRSVLSLPLSRYSRGWRKYSNAFGLSSSSLVILLEERCEERRRTTE